MFVDAGGVHTYYERQGSGSPVILLHGGGSNGQSMSVMAEGLSEHYEVFVPDRRGHGRTPDVDGPVTMDLMADDTIAFAEALGLGQVTLIGWSDGGKVAAWAALKRPDLVHKLVLIGAELTRAGGTPAIDVLMTTDEGLEELRELVRPQYEEFAPDGPEHFSVVFAKWSAMWQAVPDVDLTDLKTLTMPVLLMQGDDDCVRIQHSAEVGKALPDAQLAVVPGTSHGLPLEKPALVNQLLLDFLADEQAQKFMPMGALDA